MKQLKHWQDPVNGLLGAWLILSPWIMGFSASTTATANMVIVGIALGAASLGAILAPRVWEEWVEAALGAWLVVSPWALKFGAQIDAMYVAVGTGIVVLVLALWTLASDKALSHLWDRAAH